MRARAVSLQVRIISLVIVIVALVLFLSTYLDSKLSEKTFAEDLREQTASLAQELAASIGARGTPQDTKELTRELGEMTRIRRNLERIDVFLFTPQGPELLASTAGTPIGRSKPVAWSEVRQGKVVAHLEREQHIWDIVAPIRWSDETAGAIEVRASLARAQRLAAMERRQSFTIMSGALVLIVGGLGWYLQRHVSQPIQTLVKTMAQAEAGDLRVEARIVRRDELGWLAASFNRALKRIKASYDENVQLLARIEHFNRELQGEVERATHTLAARHEELRQTHARLFEVQRQLNRTERLAMAGQLAATMAHEISTPLNSISGQAQLLLQRDDLHPEAAERLQIIEAQIARVVEILQTLLAASAQAEPVFKPVELPLLVKGLLDLMAPVLSRKGVEIATALDVDLPPVVGDAAQLQQVLLNCIVNALDAMPDGGTLSLTTRPVFSGERGLLDEAWSPPPGLAHPLSSVTADAVEIIVADTGIGIAPEHLECIFEPFFTTKAIGKGTGLGLSICQRIMNAHGGRIEVESQVGVGTTFRIVLPALKG
jgi:two-component system NtrC family sensor kinase